MPKGNRKKREQVPVKSPGKFGRPKLWSDDTNGLAKRACLLGATNKKLAQFFDVSEDTIDNWIKTRPDFAKAVYEGREGADAHVAESLYHRAIGFSHKAEKIFCTKDGDIVRAKYTEQYAPDTGAGIFWLKNRNRSLWKDKVDVSGGGQGGNTFNDNRVQQVVVNAADASKAYRQLVGR